MFLHQHKDLNQTYIRASNGHLKTTRQPTVSPSLVFEKSLSVAKDFVDLFVY